MEIKNLGRSHISNLTAHLKTLEIKRRVGYLKKSTRDSDHYPSKGGIKIDKIRNEEAGITTVSGSCVAQRLIEPKIKLIKN